MRATLPRGSGADEFWDARHHAVLLVLWLHAAGIPFFAVAVGYPLAHGVVDALPVALFAACASLRNAAGGRARSVLATIGLLTASAVLVHLAGGSTEMHFHFFVMIALVAVYQDWLPFGAALVFVAVHHTFIGWLTPHDVYDHPQAAARPLLWAIIHATFVLGASAAQLLGWSMSERQHDKQEAALRSSERRFRALIEHSTDAITVIGREGIILYDSPSVERVFGLPASERQGRADMSSMHPDDMAPVVNAMLGLPEGESTSFECRFVTPTGTIRWCACRATNLMHVPEIEGYVINYRDITDRFHDPLTNAPNRALFARRVERAPRSTVLCIGLDDLKGVNDGLGYEAGDEVLRVVAERIAASVGGTDAYGRLAGDEFGVLLDSMAPEDGYEVASRLLLAINEPVLIGDVDVTITCSIGVACGGDNVLHSAELTMHNAKRLGGGRVELFEDGLREAVLDRLALKVDLRRAVAAGELVPYYQPIMSLATSRLVSAEALVRWVHPERGVLSPAMFIELAEETGLIVDIGREVLSQACTDALSWPAPMSVSVNLSARQLQDACLAATVADVLRETGLAPARLTLEITESVLVSDPIAAARVLAELKALGVSLSLDDFGTGYSSLSYLNRFPVDGLKIDKTFVDAVDTGVGNERALLQAIVGLGRTLELTVVAEGIERPQQWAALQTLGCGLGQGYLFAAPMPRDQFLSFAATALVGV